MNYLICKDGKEDIYKIACRSRAKSTNYLRGEWKRIEKMFPEYHSFRIVTEEEFKNGVA